MIAVSALPFLLLLIFYPILPESPRYLMVGPKNYSTICNRRGRSIPFCLVLGCSFHVGFLGVLANGGGEGEGEGKTFILHRNREPSTVFRVSHHPTVRGGHLLLQKNPTNLRSNLTWQVKGDPAGAWKILKQVARVNGVGVPSGTLTLSKTPCQAGKTKEGTRFAPHCLTQYLSPLLPRVEPPFNNISYIYSKKDIL